MKTNMKAIAGIIIAAALAIPARAQFSPITMVNQPVTDTFTVTQDLLPTGLQDITVSAIYSTATYAAVNLSNGSKSTGTITVSNYASLASATATNNITVTSTVGIAGAAIVVTPPNKLLVPGPGLRSYIGIAGRDWTATAYSSSTATSIYAWMQTIPQINVSLVAGQSVIYTTAASFGSEYNKVQVYSSTQAALTVATPALSGGQNNASLYVAGNGFTQGNQWTAATSNAATTNSLTAALKASTNLSAFIAFSSGNALGSVIWATSTANGAYSAFALSASTPALVLSGASMTGGIDSAWTINSATISAPSHGYVTGLAVLLSTGGITPPTPLVNQATYYVYVVDANDIQLAATSTGAFSGAGLVITSSSTQVGAKNLTLTPLAPSGTAGVALYGSVDDVNFFSASASSFTVTMSGSLTANSYSWPLGYVGFRYLRANVAGPQAGALNLNVTITGLNQ